MSERRPSGGVLLHVGYHKAGSTWLQQVLFADPRLSFRQPFERNELNERIVAPNALRFDATHAREHFAACGGAGAVSVLSNERFSGNPHAGGWDARMLAERLALLFPDARVLIVVREQRSAIRSCYLQYVREGGAESLARYLAPPAAGRFRRPLFDLDFFAYDALIGCYQRLFGAERVLVLPYELLARDALSFASRVCAFAGVPPPDTLPDVRPNVALSALAASLKRPVNLLFVRDASNPAAPFPIEGANARLGPAFARIDRRLPSALKRRRDAAMHARVAAVVGDRYRESNRRTSELTALELTAFGYAT